MKKQFTYFDAPVSGGVTGAAAGTLTFMVGAPSEDAFKVMRFWAFPISNLFARKLNLSLLQWERLSSIVKNPVLVKSQK